MKRVLVLLGIALLLGFSTYLWGKTSPPTFIPAKTVAVVFSSTIQGEVEPCG